MRIQRRVIQLARDREQRGSHRCESRVAAGFALGGLKEPIDIEGLDERIRLPGLRPGNDALEEAAYEPSYRESCAGAAFTVGLGGTIASRLQDRVQHLEIRQYGINDA
jgi:hypothetical protein